MMAKAINASDKPDIVTEYMEAYCRLAVIVDDVLSDMHANGWPQLCVLQSYCEVTDYYYYRYHGLRCNVRRVQSTATTVGQAQQWRKYRKQNIRLVAY